MDTKVSFKSNIKFVNYKTFKKLCESQNVSMIDYNTTGVYKVVTKSRLSKSPLLCTEDVRTCTAGGLVIPNKKALAFHVYHSAENYTWVERLFKKYLFVSIPKPQRGLLLGAKRTLTAPSSLPNFHKINGLMSSKTDNISLFECHRFSRSGTSFCYSLSDDTWHIYSSYNIKGKSKPVNSIRRLKRAFMNIKIANGDRLFIENNEITRKKYPELFAKFSIVKDGSKESLSCWKRILKILGFKSL